MKTILIIKVGALGDVLRTTFLPPILKKKHSSCTITWVTAKGAIPLLENNPTIDKLLTHEESSNLSEQFDIIINLDDEKKSAELASRLKKGLLIGAYTENGKIAYTKNAEAWFSMGILRPENQGGIKKADELKAANTKTTYELISEISGVEYNNEKPILNLTDEEKDFRRQFTKRNDIKESDKVIGLNTGSGGRWNSKQWSLEHTAELAQLLSQNGYKVILLGGKEESERNKEILRRCPGLIDSGTNNSLREFASIVNICNALVTTDTLALHIASALNKYIFALFGHTSSAEISTFGKGKKFTPHTRACFYKPTCNESPRCIDTITPEEVFEELKHNI